MRSTIAQVNDIVQRSARTNISKGHCDADVTVKTCWDLTENFAFRTITSTVTRIQPVGRKLGQVPCYIWLFAILCWSVWDRLQPVQVGMWLFGDRKTGHPEVEGVAFSHEQWKKKISSVTRQPLMKYAWCYYNNMCVNLIHKAIYPEVGVCCQWSPVLLALSGKNEQ